MEKRSSNPQDLPNVNKIQSFEIENERAVEEIKGEYVRFLI